MTKYMSRRLFVKKAAASGAGLMILSSSSLRSYAVAGELNEISTDGIISDGITYSQQPAITLDGDENLWATWVGHLHDTKQVMGPHTKKLRWASVTLGDRLYCAHRDANGWGKPAPVTQELGNYTYPRIVCSKKTLYAFWTATGKIKTSIWMSSSSNGKWSRPVRVSPEQGYHQNCSVCVDPKGTIWMAWQSNQEGSYDVFLASFDGKTWSDPIKVTDNSGNDWDPVIASDSRGAIWIVWTRFYEADYDLYAVSCSNGRLGDKLRLGDHTAYDLHPSVTVDAKNRLWVAWDRVKIACHADSGPSNPGNKKRRRLLGNNLRSKTSVSIRCIDGKNILAPAQADPKFPPARFFAQTGSYPKIMLDKNGALWLCIRAYHKFSHWLGKWDGRYWFDVLLYRYAGNEWSQAFVLDKSDGFLDQPAVIATKKGGWVVYQTDYTFPQILWGSNQWKRPEGDVPYFSSSDNPALLGELRAQEVQLEEPAQEPALVKAPPLSDNPSSLSAHIVPKKHGAYSTEYNSEELRLFWGDTHRHSARARCTAGRPEPSPEDLWKYGHDVYQCDFMCIADHGPFSKLQAWEDHKLTDLYHVPGSMVTFYAYEDSGEQPHVNIISPDRQGTLAQGNVLKNGSLWKSIRDTGLRVVGIPHLVHGCKWPTYVHDAKYAPVMEIFQACRMATEARGAPRSDHKPDFVGYAQDGLAMGHKFGFICSTDHFNGSCYAGVYAKSLSRDDVFDAICNRRCFGSTVYGIVVDFRSDGHLMGEEYQTSKGASLSAYVKAYAPVDSIEIIRYSKADGWTTACDVSPGKKEHTLEWKEDKPSEETVIYYVRVILKDCEMAWSSPVWVAYKL